MEKRMNDKNQKLLFSDSDEETVVITLTDEDGQDIDAEIMAALEIEEFGKEYVAVMPQQATEDLRVFRGCRGESTVRPGRG